MMGDSSQARFLTTMAVMFVVSVVLFVLGGLAIAYLLSIGWLVTNNCDGALFC